MPHSFSNFSHALKALPATLSLIGLSVLGFALIELPFPSYFVSSLTFFDFEQMGTVIAFKPNDGQYWRLVTPIFLHFGWLHIIFNSLWIWELAGLVESRLGWARLLLLVLVCAAGSNITQAVVSGPSLFGGMSGVVYGLLGFCWVYQSLQPRAGLQIPQGILLFMLGWLVLCMVVPTQSLGIGAVANGAHLGGLIIGCLVAGLVGLGARLAK